MKLGAAAWIALLTLSHPCIADNIRSSFNQIDKAALTERGFVVDGEYIFTIGVMPQHYASKNSKKHAMMKSKLIASNRFSWLAYDEVNWPKSYSAELTQIFFRQHLMLSEVKVESSKVIILGQGELENGSCYTILGAKTRNIHAPDINFINLKKLFYTAYRDKDKRLDLFVYYEFSLDRNQDAHIPLVQMLSARYGEQLNIFLQRSSEQRTRNVTSTEGLLTKSELNNLSLNRLFDLIGGFYLDSNLCSTIRDKLASKALIRSSVFISGTCEKILGKHKRKSDPQSVVEVLTR